MVDGYSMSLYYAIMYYLAILFRKGDDMLKKIGLMVVVASMAMTANMAWANNSAKEALVKKVYKEEYFSDYADTSFKKLIQQTNRELDKFSVEGEEACWMEEGSFLGLTVQDESMISNFKINHLQNGLTRATFKNHGVRQQVDFKISCQGKTCVINEIYSKIDGRSYNVRQSFQHNLNRAKTSTVCPFGY